MTQTTTDASPKLARIWYQAIRPRSLTATYVPIALGGVIAYEAGFFNLAYLLLALLGTLALQIAANLLNEYFDYVKGIEAGKTEGLGMILKNDLLKPREVLAGGIFALLIGVVVGLFFVWQTGPFILFLGMAAVAIVVLYTAGPFALAYIGLGEIAVFIFMGPLIVLGVYYVMGEQIDNRPIIGALPIALVVTAILQANNLRDLEADRIGGRKTLAVRFGRDFGRAEYLVLTLGAHVLTLILVIAGLAPWPVLLVLLTLPETWRLCHVVLTSAEVPALHQVLIQTARLHARFGAAYVLGWLIGIWL